MNSNIIYNETEIVPLLKRRDERSFNYLYDNYSAALYGIVLQIVSDRETANDILQEVYINIWSKIESYDSKKGRLFTWMLNLARNLAIDKIRSKTYRNSKKNINLCEHPYFKKGELEIYVNVDHIGLKKAIQKLKPEYWNFIELAYYKGYTYEQIAEIEGLPLGTVKTKMRNTMRELRAYFNRPESKSVEMFSGTEVSKLPNKGYAAPTKLKRKKSVPSIDYQILENG